MTAHDSPSLTYFNQGAAAFAPATPTRKVAGHDGGDDDADETEGEGKERRGGQLGPSPLPSRRTANNAVLCATTTASAAAVVETDAAAPCWSSTVGSGTSGGATAATSTATAGILSEKQKACRGRFQEGKRNATGSAIDGATGAAAIMAPSGKNYSASSAFAASTRVHEQLEVETVGWEGTSSPLCDPEITHPGGSPTS